MKDINDFKNKIKNQDELMSLDEVKGMLAEPPTGFFAAKWKQIGTLVIAVLGAVSALFWLSPSESNETVATESEPIVENTTDSLSQLTIDSVLSDKETINAEMDQPASKRNYTYRPASTPKIARTYLDNTASSNPITQKDEVRTAPSLQAPKNNKGNFPKSESYYFDGWQKESQSFTIDPSKSNVLRGEEGTILIIPPFAVCGNYESFESEIQLTEYYKKEDMLLAQLTTMSHGDLLESAGMIEITATANGKELKLCKNITVLFPSNKYEDNTYVGFSGTWDHAHNNVDWTQLSVQNFNFFGGTVFADCSRPKYQAIRCNWDARKNALKTRGKSNLRKDYRNDEVIRRIRKRFWFQDSCTSDLYDQVYEGIKYKMKDSMSASAYHACRLSKAKAESLRNFLDSLRNGGQVAFDPNILDQQTGYILATVSDLGPVNCDRFTNYKNKSTHTYKIGESEGTVASRMIFRDILSVMPGTQKGTNEVEFANIPNGERVTLLVIKHMDSSILLAHQEMSVGDEPNLYFEEVSKADITEMLKAIANGEKTVGTRTIREVSIP